MATKLTCLDPKNALFENIKKGNTPEWWDDVIKDPEVYIELRKNHQMDVYYNGGAIFREVKLVNGEYTWKTHAKFLCKSEYIGPKEPITQIRIGESDWLRKIKNNIKTYYPTSSEKGYQAKLITQQHYFIDTEFAYNGDVVDDDVVVDDVVDDRKRKRKRNGNRFDLVWLDVKKKKIVVVELKLTDNGELYTDSIYKQLDKYVKLIEAHGDKLQKYFKRVFDCKKAIGLLPDELKGIENINDFTIEPKPLLLVGNCSKDWIPKNKEKLNDKLKEVALGVYYYGDSEFNIYH